MGWSRYPAALALAAYRRLDHRLVQYVDAVCTAPGTQALERTSSLYGRRAVAVTLGLDRALLDTARSPAPMDEPGLLTVNYLHPRKRIDMVIRALAALGNEASDDIGSPTLTIVGDGPEHEELSRLAVRLGVGDRVHFTGFISDSVLAEHYWSTSCYVHAASEESFGLSLIEAAYCMAPVVAVREGGVADNVIDGRSGYLVGATPEALAQGIRRVLRDPTSRQRLGRVGREWVASKYTWQQGAEDLLAAIRTAL